MGASPSSGGASAWGPRPPAAALRRGGRAPPRRRSDVAAWRPRTSASAWAWTQQPVHARSSRSSVHVSIIQPTAELLRGGRALPRQRWALQHAVRASRRRGWLRASRIRRIHRRRRRRSSAAVGDGASRRPELEIRCGLTASSRIAVGVGAKGREGFAGVVAEVGEGPRGSAEHRRGRCAPRTGGRRDAPDEKDVAKKKGREKNELVST